MLSVDLAWVVASLVEEIRVVEDGDDHGLRMALFGHPDLKMGFSGLESLKGVLRERPYPIVWVETTTGDTIDKFDGTGALPISRDHKKLCEEFILEEESAESWLIRPYWFSLQSFSQTPKFHEVVIDSHLKKLLRNRIPGEVTLDETIKEEGTADAESLMEDTQKSGDWLKPISVQVSLSGGIEVQESSAPIAEIENESVIREDNVE